MSLENYICLDIYIYLGHTHTHTHTHHDDRMVRRDFGEIWSLLDQIFQKFSLSVGCVYNTSLVSALKSSGQSNMY